MILGGYVDVFRVPGRMTVKIKLVDFDGRLWPA